MNEIKLSERQREILNLLRGRAAAEKRSHFDRVLTNSHDASDIDIVCRLINDEYLMTGIEPNYNPNAYGRELESLLNTVNKPRLT
jgi:hypothetical protein